LDDFQDSVREICKKCGVSHEITASITRKGTNNDCQFTANVTWRTVKERQEETTVMCD